MWFPQRAKKRSLGRKEGRTVEKTESPLRGKRKGRMKGRKGKRQRGVEEGCRATLNSNERLGSRWQQATGGAAPVSPECLA